MIIFNIIIMRNFTVRLGYGYDVGDVGRSSSGGIGGSVFLVEFFRPYAFRRCAGLFDVCCFGSVAAPHFCQIFWHRHFIRYFFDTFPLVTEGTYWMSASTRIVTGLFFAVLAGVFFVRWLEKKGNSLLSGGLFMIFQLLAYGFYEQVLVFSVTLILLLAFLERKMPAVAFGSVCGALSRRGSILSLLRLFPKVCFIPDALRRYL